MAIRVLGESELAKFVEMDIPSIIINDQSRRTMIRFGQGGTKAAAKGRVLKAYESPEYEEYRAEVLARQLP
jgi:hypothetical protein